MTFRAVLPLMTLFQPVNALVFVYDGIAAASKDYEYSARSVFLCRFICLAGYVVSEATYGSQAGWCMDRNKRINVWKGTCAWSSVSLEKRAYTPL
ncbi:unnamed protein product [Heterosigma akashiwo]